MSFLVASTDATPVPTLSVNTFLKDNTKTLYKIVNATWTDYKINRFGNASYSTNKSHQGLTQRADIYARNMTMNGLFAEYHNDLTGYNASMKCFHDTEVLIALPNNYTHASQQILTAIQSVQSEIYNYLQPWTIPTGSVPFTCTRFSNNNTRINRNAVIIENFYSFMIPFYDDVLKLYNM
ncbi:uncharacterized protein LOC117101939 [Anneissia japonica]|uniref:uncharacterized protein LOC117101939 n=1 Tax=Anneissia japonica TaxID=1529436 RepID=UPI00142586D7|nr:uncharacterized protein LOC117101939 [Anneissia japonica]